MSNENGKEKENKERQKKKEEILNEKWFAARMLFDAVLHNKMSEAFWNT